jgi:hypothetical protein
MLGVAVNRPAQILFASGCLMAGALSVGFLVKASPDGAPYVIAVFGLFIFAFVAVTGHSVLVAPSAITAGGLVGVAAALGPALVLMLWPPVPRSSVWAWAMVAAAFVAAAVFTGLRSGFRLVNAVLSGLLAAVVAALLIGPVVAAMVRFGPEVWVPEMESHALTPAAQLAERRSLAGEPYLFVLLPGAVLALILGVVALRTRGRVHTALPVRPVDGPRQIELGEVEPLPGSATGA